MYVEDVVPFHAMIRLPYAVSVRRWRCGMRAGWNERHISLGHLPDGRWWVRDTGNKQHGWVYQAATSQEARNAAERKVVELQAGEVWEPSVATYDPANPNAALAVPEWPEGHEPK